MAHQSVIPFFTGRLLLAMPAIGDPRFSHAVLAIVNRDAEGALGIGIAETGDYPVSEILDQCGLAGTITPDPMVLVGGPVEQSRGFVLHSDDWGGVGTIDVAGKFAVSGSIDVLRAIAKGNGPSQWLVAMGYAGWGPGQLEAEIAEGAWHVTHIDARILYELEPEERWAAAMARDGIDPNRIAVRGGTA